MADKKQLPFVDYNHGVKDQGVLYAQFILIKVNQRQVLTAKIGYHLLLNAFHWHAHYLFPGYEEVLQSRNGRCSLTTYLCVCYKIKEYVT